MSQRRRGRLATLGVAVAIVLGSAVAPAALVDAGKPTLAIAPTPVTLDATFTLSGCGYPTPTSLSFRVVGPGIDYFTAGEPLGQESGGCFQDTWLAWWGTAGDYQITSYYRDNKGATRKSGVVKFAVVP